MIIYKTVIVKVDDETGLRTPVLDRAVLSGIDFDNSGSVEFSNAIVADKPAIAISDIVGTMALLTSIHISTKSGDGTASPTMIVTVSDSGGEVSLTTRLFALAGVDFTGTDIVVSDFEVTGVNPEVFIILTVKSA